MTVDAELLIRRCDSLEAQLAKLENVVSSLKSIVMRQEERRSVGQPDWLAVADPAKAERLLVETLAWVQLRGTYLRVNVVACWPWHPEAVVLLLAASQHYNMAYRSDAPDRVSDYHGRFLPATRRGLKDVTSDCNRLTHYEAPDAAYVAHLDQVPDLARWWATSREGTIPGLTRQLTAVG